MVNKELGFYKFYAFLAGVLVIILSLYLDVSLLSNLLVKVLVGTVVLLMVDLFIFKICQLNKSNIISLVAMNILGLAISITLVLFIALNSFDPDFIL